MSSACPVICARMWGMCVVSMFEYAHACALKCVCVHMYVHMHVFVCLCMCMCVCICTCAYTCMCVCKDVPKTLEACDISANTDLFVQKNNKGAPLAPQ